MRLFTAIDLPAETASRLEALLAQLRPAARLRWSRVENLHVTTKFIGEWPEGRLKELTSALATIPSEGAIEMGLRGLGYFPDERHPRVFWVAVDAPDALARLAKRTDETASRLGVPRETNSYRPHLTLARLNSRNDPPGSLAALRRAVESIPEPDCGRFVARDWHLYLSEPSSRGSRYTKLETFPLT